MDFTNPVLNAHWPDPDVVCLGTEADIGLFAAARFGAPISREHVTFGPVSVDVVGVEEVAA